MSQAIASIGQIHLTNVYRKIFEKNKIKIGQILISLDDTEQEEGLLMLKELLKIFLN